MAFLLVDEKGNQQVKKKDKGAEKVNFLDENINKIINADCLDIFKQLPDKCIDLVLTDPPYFGIVKNKWDNQWKDILFAPIDVRADRFVSVVAKQSGSKERTVQKSFARLVAIGKVVLNADTTFTMGELYE